MEKVPLETMLRKWVRVAIEVATSNNKMRPDSVDEAHLNKLIDAILKEFEGDLVITSSKYLDTSDKLGQEKKRKLSKALDPFPGLNSFFGCGSPVLKYLRIILHFVFDRSETIKLLQDIDALTNDGEILLTMHLLRKIKSASAGVIVRRFSNAGLHIYGSNLWNVLQLVLSTEGKAKFEYLKDLEKPRSAGGNHKDGAGTSFSHEDIFGMSSGKLAELRAKFRTKSGKDSLNKIPEKLSPENFLKIYFDPVFRVLLDNAEGEMLSKLEYFANNEEKLNLVKAVFSQIIKDKEITNFVDFKNLYKKDINESLGEESKNVFGNKSVFGRLLTIMVGAIFNPNTIDINSILQFLDKQCEEGKKVSMSYANDNTFGCLISDIYNKFGKARKDYFIMILKAVLNESGQKWYLFLFEKLILESKNRAKGNSISPQASTPENPVDDEEEGGEENEFDKQDGRSARTLRRKIEENENGDPDYYRKISVMTEDPDW